MPPPLGKGTLSDGAHLTSAVCLSVAYMSLSRGRKTKLAQR